MQGILRKEVEFNQSIITIRIVDSYFLLEALLDPFCPLKLKKF